MNAHLRRYLDEEWDEQDELEQPPRRSPRDSKPAPSATSVARRQASKEWGRAIAKHQRSIQKQRGSSGKP
jgi:hypothetical protein